ncbi:MAG: DUF1801 domain-containing protein [Planctomycetota bacterium]|nr:DUF1801 domain-containing protein [Planctomycetota bacterium]
MKKPTTKKKPAAKPRAAAESNDWRAETITRIRTLIQQADRSIIEETKWRKPTNPAGVPAWSHPEAGLICTGETYKDKVKITFARGAALEDPANLFNASLEGKARRAIDLHENDKLNERAFNSLIREAVAHAD